jgi:hypothetical protein
MEKYNQQGWRQGSKASGGQYFSNKDLDVEVFIDYSGNARICRSGSGYWDYDFQITKNQTIAEIIDKLLEGYKKCTCHPLTPKEYIKKYPNPASRF